MPAPTVEMKHITKRFPGTLANNSVDFTAYRGEIHALLGENGAGKSTLMSILTGVLRPDEGEILIRGKKMIMRAPKDSLACGVGMIYQHFKLIRPFTVAENIVMGLDTVRVLRRRKIEKSVQAIAQKYDLEISPSSYIWQLSVGEQQRVEIIKVLYLGADILILDEPTAVLTPQEVTALFRTLRKMADDGCTIIFITHKMSEVMEYADRITVLRGGETVATMSKQETTPQELARQMVGQEVSTVRINQKNTVSDVVLKVRDLCVRNDKGLEAVDHLSFDLRAGEILGIAGVSGNGQKELCEALTGLRKKEAGTVTLRGGRIEKFTARQILDAGVSFIPEDRYGTGLIAELSVLENASIRCYYKPKFCRHKVLNRKKLLEQARQFIGTFQIKVNGPEALVKSMSGGNAQKLILARETAEAPAVIIAAYPVRGLDILATDFIHRTLVQEKNNGAAILLVSEDLDEIFSCADRVAVLYEGNFTAEMPVEQAERETLGLAMAGTKMGRYDYETQK